MLIPCIMGMEFVRVGVINADLLLISSGAVLLIVAIVLAASYEKISSKFGFMIHSPGTSLYAAFFESLPERRILYISLVLSIIGLIFSASFLTTGYLIAGAIGLVVTLASFILVVKKLFVVSSKLVPEEIEDLDLWSEDEN